MNPDDLIEILNLIADALDDPDHSTVSIRAYAARILDQKERAEAEDYDNARRHSMDSEFGAGAYDRWIAKKGR